MTRADEEAVYHRFKSVRRGIDLVVTLLLWAYFTMGFVVMFAPFYVIAFVQFLA